MKWSKTVERKAPFFPSFRAAAAAAAAGFCECPTAQYKHAIGNSAARKPRTGPFSKRASPKEGQRRTGFS